VVSRTAWTAGNGVGFTWSTAIASSQMTSMANTNVVLDTTDITNQTTALDIFCDISISLIIASSTIAAGANIAIWLAILNQDGTTYGDNKIVTTAGGSAIVPSYAPIAVIPCFAAATQTTIIGNALGLVIPPGTFRWALQNNSGFALTAGTQTVKYRTYNTNLNN
jgi:hypothetical protein